MAVPVNYRKSSEAAIASYNYTDIAEGTGVVVLYGVETEDNTTKDYSLVLNSICSTEISTGVTIPTGAATKGLDLDFDVKFNLPKILKGVVRAQITWSSNASGGANLGGTSYVVLRVRKFSEGVETEIAMNTKSKTLVVAYPSQAGQTALIEIPINTRIHFKKDDILRMTVELWSTASAGGDILSLYHDATGSSTAISGIQSTKMIFQVPFVVDI